MAVKFDQHVDIDAPAEKVWSVLVDPNTWPLWMPDVEQVTNVSAVQSGGTFQFRSGGEVHTGAIAGLDPSAFKLSLVTQSGGGPVTHTFDVDNSGGFLGMGGNDARLRYTMEYDPPGGFLGDFVAGGNPKDTLKVKHALEKVKGLAEGHA